MFTVSLDITEPILDVHLPPSAERMQCLVRAGNEHIGGLSLPICDGCVPGYVIADAISAEFAWQILGLFFQRTVYRTLMVKREKGGLSLWRGGLRLTEALPINERTLREQSHDRVGWVIFLQEIWGQADWPDSRFYSKNIRTFAERAPRRSVRGKWAAIEVSETVPKLKVSEREIHTVFTVGGIAIGTVTVPVTRGRVSASELRVALTVGSGFELCRAAVREALLERSLDEPIALRARLASARNARLARGTSEPDTIEDPLLAPGSAPAFDLANLTSEDLLMVLGQRAHEPMGTSASRRATLPTANLEELLDLAKLGRDPAVRSYGRGERPSRVMYAPELIPRSPPEGPMEGPLGRGTGELANERREPPLYGRHYFETLFATHVDPWRYTNPYEREKYEQTLSLIPEGEIGRAIELGCAEGHFTAQLAPRVRSLVASDISQVALERAARRLQGLGNVRFMRLDFMNETIPGRFDLVVCSEVLYFTDGREQLRAVARKLANALEPGGHLVTAHANQVVDEPEKPGFDWGLPFGAKVIGDTLSDTRGLRMLTEIRTPLYRVQLFRREARRFFDAPTKKPEIVEAQHFSPLPPQIAAQVSWNGAHVPASRPAQKVVTSRLPILMYHSVSADGPSGLARYRVAPRAFEQQLQYLQDTGFRSVTLEQWRLAMEARRPLPGRAVIITFDDGYADFLTEAWPLLAKYGFSAIVFLVAGRVGQTNEWDEHHGQEMPLLGWEEIRKLQTAGIEFGSHTLSHRPLMGLPIQEVVREAARSKTILERNLDARIRSLAYPYGASDDVIHRLVGACGYTFGMTGRSSPSQFNDWHLALPRIEVQGDDGLQEFAAKVGTAG